MTGNIGTKFKEVTQKRKIFLFGFVVLTLVSLVIAKNTGLIEKKNEIKNLSDKCKNVEESRLTSCRIEVMNKVIEEKGIDAGFELLSIFFENNPLFASECHDFAHILGEEAYELFINGEEFEPSTKTAYCAYGFYHGFMELLISEEGDVTLARDFCAYIDEKLGEKAPGTYLACYHGIGHGWTDGQEEFHWGDEKGMAEPALALCEKVAETEHELLICATGVFDSISIGYYNQAYGLEIKENDPFWLCRIQEKEIFKEACYMDIMPAIIWLGDYDLEESLKYLKYAEEEYLDLSVNILAENSVRFILRREEKPLDHIDTCRGLGGDIVLNCISGLATGVMQFGVPEKEYIGALEFCSSNRLTESEKEVCYRNVLRYAQGRYPEEKVASICKGVDEKYQTYCRVN